MIVTNLAAKDCSAQVPPAVARAMIYLRENDFMQMRPGEYPIEGIARKDMYAKVFDVTTKPLEQTRSEIHKEYIDVQFWPEGEELMGYAPLVGSAQVTEANEAEDIYFLTNPPEEVFVPAAKGDVMVLFCGDIHRPAVAKDKPLSYRKVVVKVSTRLL